MNTALVLGSSFVSLPLPGEKEVGQHRGETRALKSRALLTVETPLRKAGDGTYLVPCVPRCCQGGSRADQETSEASSRCHII